MKLRLKATFEQPKRQIRRVIDALDLDTILMYDMTHVDYAKGTASANTLETNNIICNYQAVLLAKLHELI